MSSDWLGNPVSAEHDSVLTAIDDFSAGFLAYETRAQNIIAAADAAPRECLANAYAGMLWMLLESPEGPELALPYLQAAERNEAGATPRERANVELLRRWIRDDTAGVIEIGDQVCAEAPRDLVVVKLLQYLHFNHGDFPALLRAALRVAEANAGNAYIHGMLAFGYEQCHLLDEAQAEALRALTLKRKEPWAQHALAHVYLTRGHIEAGVNFLEGMRDTWTGLNSFMYTHLWWHLALFYLSQGRNADVLEIYDRHCWGIAKTYSQDQIGAVSLLARMEISGIDIGNRWQELGEYLAPRAHDTVQPFLTLQYIYGLARAGRPQADELLTATRERAGSAPDDTRAVWTDVVVPACEGLMAHARGDFVTARERLGLVLPRLIETGGSHAQRDLFEQILLDARIKSGALNLAQQTLELRRASDPTGVPVNRALASVYEALGLPAQAQQARSRLGAFHHAG